MSDFVAVNDLEGLLIEAQTGRLHMPDFLRQFVQSRIVVPSASEVTAGWQGFHPLVFKKQGVEMLACFTAHERIGSAVEKMPYYLEIRAAEFLKSLQPNVGVVINPGHSVSFDISPEGLARIRAEFT
jgi:SseB protein N-terminal domain